LTAKGPDREVLVLRYLELMAARNVAAVLAMANQHVAEQPHPPHRWQA
jgi:hypothetical protein